MKRMKMMKVFSMIHFHKSFDFFVRFLKFDLCKLVADVFYDNYSKIKCDFQVTSRFLAEYSNVEVKLNDR